MSKPLTNQIYFDLCARFDIASEKIVQSEAILKLISSDERMQKESSHDIYFSLWAVQNLLETTRDCIDEAEHEIRTLEPDDFLEWLKKLNTSKQSQEAQPCRNH